MAGLVDLGHTAARTHATLAQYASGTMNPVNSALIAIAKRSVKCRHPSKLGDLGDLDYRDRLLILASGITQVI